MALTTMRTIGAGWRAANKKSFATLDECTAHSLTLRQTTDRGSLRAMDAEMSARYSRYTRLKFDAPYPKVLRITMDNGKLNTADRAMHDELARIWRDSTPIPTSTPRSSPAPGRCSPPTATST
jgi:hypothetical protein